MSMYAYCMFIYFHHVSRHSSATMTEVFPCFVLSCKANARVKPAKTGHGPHSSKIFVLFYVLFFFVSFCVLLVCTYVLYYCHRVATKLQLTNMSYLETS
jgi:magnesium-transporting ATPase (P-type)